MTDPLDRNRNRTCGALQLVTGAGRPGWWTTRYSYGWISRLGVYRLSGNVHWATAHARR